MFRFNIKEMVASNFKNENNNDLAIFTILKLIKDMASVSQAKLSELSGYSRSTISINCEKLISRGLIVLDTKDSNNKKKNLEYTLNTKFGLIVGIGMGGSTCRIGIYNINCELQDMVRIPVDLIRGPEPIMEAICTSLNQLLLNHPYPILGIGFAIPSPIKYEEGVAYHPAFMPGWHLFNIKEYFTRRYNCPTFVENEVNTMALEEYNLIKDSGVQTLLGIKIGTGIGAGLIINNKIYRGENGGGGNLGHIQIDGVNEPCACGKIGCVETIASVPAINKQALKICEQYPSSLLGQYYKKEGKVDYTTVKICADQGDRYALKIIEDAGRNLGKLLGRITVFLDPGKIILSGRLTYLGSNYLYYVRDALKKQADPWLSSESAIQISTLSEDSSAQGAARLCISELIDRHLLADGV